MRQRTLVCMLISFAFLLPYVSGAYAQTSKSDTADRVREAVLVLKEFQQSPDREAAAGLIRRSAAVAVFPSVYKGAIIVGAQFGRGLVCAYDKETGVWSAPAFFTLGGGSIGYQIGGQSADLILVITNERGLRSLLKGKFTLGADASVAAGPVGRTAQADTDVLLKAEIYSYSRTRGAFAGVSLKGAVIASDDEANRAHYGKTLFASDILLDRKVLPEEQDMELIRTLNTFMTP